MQYNIYFRKDNWVRFEKEENKSRLINELLDAHYGTTFGDIMTSVYNPRKPVDVVKVATEEFVPKPPDPLTGYPCCQQKRPCKHWSFNGATSTWTNELTGKTKEVVV